MTSLNPSSLTGEWVESISKGETSIKELLALVDESLKESNRCQFLKGLNNKTKLTFYKTFGGEVKGRVACKIKCSLLMT